MLLAYAGNSEEVKQPVMLEESALSIVGVLFEAELAVVGFEQEELSEELAAAEHSKATEWSGSGALNGVQDATALPAGLERVSTEALVGPAWASEVCFCFDAL
jgi:hypothetical protein